MQCKTRVASHRFYVHVIVNHNLNVRDKKRGKKDSDLLHRLFMVGDCKHKINDSDDGWEPGSE